MGRPIRTLALVLLFDLITCPPIPILLGRSQKMAMIASREKVRKLQLQTMLADIEKSEEELKTMRKRSVADDENVLERVTRESESNIESQNFNRLFNDPWDIAHRQVPFDTLIKRNKIASLIKNNKKIHREASPQTNDNDENLLTPCRHKRRRRDIFNNTNNSTTNNTHGHKRSVVSPEADGLVPGYNIYDELCEDAQPVEIVKIHKLSVEDGVIRDADIIEKRLLSI